MSINRPQNRSFFVAGGNVKTTGGALSLAKGQLAVVDVMSSSSDGAAILGSFLGIPKDKQKLAIRVGVEGKEPDRSHSDKAGSTPAFSLKQIEKIRARAPKITTQTVDDVVLGYDGFDESTAFSFKTGQKHMRISLKIENGLLSYRGGKEACEEVHVDIDIPDCDPYADCEDCDQCASVDCQAITLEAIDRLKTKQLAGGKPVSEFVDITPVFSCDNDVTNTLIPFTYYTLEVCDTGDQEALSLIAAQYDVPVIRTNRVGSISTYQILLRDSLGTPDAYAQTVASIIKGCEDCPAGYSEVEGGYVYAITIEDNGVDVSATIEAELANAKVVAGTVQRAEGGSAGVGFYTAVYSSLITAAEVATFTATSANARNTATVDLVGSTESICEDDTVTETDWVAGDSCNAVEEVYSIVLPDNECGEDRLSELNAAYNNLVVTIADSPTLSDVIVTVTGTSGTANVNIDGTDYLATFDTDLDTTASNFVTTHAAAILAAHDVTVSADGDELTFGGITATVDTIAVANASGDLDGTVAASVAQEDRKNCQTRYETSVISNLVCEECSPVFLDFYQTTAPESFDETLWALNDDQGSVASGNCLCGIRFKGKTFLVSGDEAIRDMIGFTETSTKIQVAGGYPDEVREGIGFINKGTFATKYFSRWTQRDNLMGNMRDLEKESKYHFLGSNYNNDYIGRILRGEEATIQENLAQMVTYYVTINRENYSQSLSGKHTDNIEYAIHVEYGKHADLESLLNNLAAAAGVEGVIA